jgi:hypothetical protein
VINGEIIDKEGRDAINFKVIQKEISLQQLLIARDIEEMTKLKKGIWAQVAPYIIVFVGFAIVGLFLLALIQQIGSLIDKINIPNCGQLAQNAAKVAGTAIAPIG